MSAWQPIETAPRKPAAPIETDIGVVGWAQALFKPPPPFFERPRDYEPERLREAGWCRMVHDDTLGWAFLVPLDIVSPTRWRHAPPPEGESET